MRKINSFVIGFLVLLLLSALPFILVSSTSAAGGAPQAASDDRLAMVRRSDAASRDAQGHLGRLTPAEHLRRANIYMTNRAFAEAREHWQAVLTFYPQDPGLAEALFGIGRSYSQERRYQEAFTFLERVAHEYPLAKEGREGLNFSAAACLRMGRPNEAVERYREYIEKYPTGERIENAHLNLIDTLREAGRPKEAIQWIAKTREKFSNTPTETNALFARLRLDVAEGNWTHAVSTAEEFAGQRFQKGVLTSAPEVAYLKAYSLEQANRNKEAAAAYLGIPDGADSYYGWLATQHLRELFPDDGKSAALQRTIRVAAEVAGGANSFPDPYRAILVKVAKSRKLDPRFILAIIKIESSFKPMAKSPAGARGLLQLTIDAAQRFAAAAGVPALTENQLYRPETSIAVGGEYLAELFRLFPHQPEAVAASYNGGEDNVARWVKRARHVDPGVFTAEIGFEETKAYVQRVMTTYRAYQILYTADLQPW